MGNWKALLIIALLAACGAAWYFLWGPGNAKIDPWTKADAYYTMGSYQRAAETYTEALEKNPNHENAGDAVYRIARSLQILEHHSDALGVYESFIREYPDHPHAGDAHNQIAKYKLEGVE